MAIEENGALSGSQGFPKKMHTRMWTPSEGSLKIPKQKFEMLDVHTFLKGNCLNLNIQTHPDQEMH